MFGLRRGRTAWAVPLLLFLAVVLVAGLAFNLANLDTGGEDVPEVPDAGGTPPASESLIGLLPLIHIALSAGAIVVIGFIIYLLKQRKKEPRPPLQIVRRSEFLRAIAFILIFVLLLAAWRQATPAEGDESGDPSQDGDGGFVAQPLPTVGGIPLAVFLAGSVFATLLVVAVLFRSPRLGRAASKAPKEPEAREAAADAVEDAIESLELGEDVRSTILLCFHRFTELMGARGVSGQEVLTPREIEGLAIERLGVVPGDAEDLTSLFEVARYSDHPLGEADRGHALRSLERIRATLGG